MRFYEIVPILTSLGFVISEEWQHSYEDKYLKFGIDACYERSFMATLNSPSGIHSYEFHSQPRDEGYTSWHMTRMSGGERALRGIYSNFEKFPITMAKFVRLHNYQIPSDMKGISVYLRSRVTRISEMVATMQDVASTMAQTYGDNCPLFIGTNFASSVVTWGEILNMNQDELGDTLTFGGRGSDSADLLTGLNNMLLDISNFNPTPKMDVWVFNDLYFGNAFPWKDNVRKWVKGSKITNIHSREERGVDIGITPSIQTMNAFQAIVELVAR